MYKKHFYTAILSMLLVFIGVQPAFATTWVIGPDQDPPVMPPETIGTWNEDTRTFTLVGDTPVGDNNIEIIDDNLTLDGNGHSVTGTGVSNSKGILLDSIRYVTIKNLTVEGFTTGIRIYNYWASSDYDLWRRDGHHTIEDNTISSCSTGINVGASNLNTVNNNTISGGNYGISLLASGNNTVTNNTVSSSDLGIDLGGGLQGPTTIGSDNNILSGNSVSNCYNGISVSSSSASNTISGNTVTDSSGDHGIFIYNSNSNILTGNNVSSNYWGIHLRSSDSTELNGNTVTSNAGGIWLELSSDYNTLTDNIVTNNTYSGIYLSIQSNNNTFTGNTSSSNRDGFFLNDSGDNTLEYNTASSNNEYGIKLLNSDNNILTNNTVSGNTEYGIWLDPSNNNQIYNNNFINNAIQAGTDSGSTNNLFNMDPPIGGNYWSDWSGSGSYTFDADGEDEYPWSTQDGWLPVADAGLDQTVECACQQGGTQVTLNGTGSTGASTYTWYGPFEGSPVIGDTVTVTLNVCLGEHEITLVINEGQQGSDTDTVIITVVDTTSPDVSHPGDVTIEAMGPDGVPKDDDRIQTFLNGAAATDNCDSEPDITNNAPAVFPIGDTTVTFTAEDAEGNTSTCQATVTVEEAAEGHLRIIPKIINREGRLQKILAVIRFPEDVTEEDIDIDQPLMLYPDYSYDGIEATHQRIITWCRWGTERVSVFATFSKDELTDVVPEDGLVDLMVVGNFMDGSYFFGIDTVRIISWTWKH